MDPPTPVTMGTIKGDAKLKKSPQDSQQYIARKKTRQQIKRPNVLTKKTKRGVPQNNPNCAIHHKTWRYTQLILVCDDEGNVKEDNSFKQIKVKVFEKLWKLAAETNSFNRKHFQKKETGCFHTHTPSAYKPSIHPKITQMKMVDKEFFFNSVRRKSETFITVQPDFGQYIVKLQYSDSQKDRNCVRNYVY